MPLQDEGVEGAASVDGDPLAEEHALWDVEVVLEAREDDVPLAEDDAPWVEVGLEAHEDDYLSTEGHVLQEALLEEDEGYLSWDWGGFVVDWDYHLQEAELFVVAESRTMQNVSGYALHFHGPSQRFVCSGLLEKGRRQRYRRHPCSEL